MLKLLIAEDESTARYAMVRALSSESTQIIEAEDGQQAFDKILAERPDLVFLDLHMPRMDGIGVLRKLRATRDVELPEIIVLTANDTVENAVECIRGGASDFLSKPFDVHHLRAIVQRSEKRVQLQQRVDNLQAELELSHQQGPLFGNSKAISRLLEQIGRAARSQLPVMIRGESGTGKELVARQLHELSDRKKAPFVAVNTAAISETLIESELFGHVKGAFTGADKPREGVFRKADGGTLFLDEIGDMPASVQTRLLRVLQESVVQPVGSEEVIRIDVRIISATHQDLESSMEEKRFRADLYYRLKGIELKIAPLRERKEDILLLAHRFLQSAQSFSIIAISKLMTYQWPGNIRELKQRVEAASVMSRSDIISCEDLGWNVSEVDSTSLVDSERLSDPIQNSIVDLLQNGLCELPLTEAKQTLVDRFESLMIARSMERADNNISEAARQLGIHRQSLQQKIKTSSNTRERN